MKLAPLLLAGLLAMGPAAAQTGRPSFSLSAPLELPPGSPLGPAPVQRAEPAPLPDRNRDPVARPAGDPRMPRLEPTLLSPTQPRLSSSFGQTPVLERDRERLMDTLIPGARLTIPIE
jgi:hypothetical protein